MARVLIVGCGCRGQALARELVEAGHAVRGTTRDPARADAIRAAGAEPYVGDPDRIATLMEAVAGTTIVCWLLGSAEGDPEAVAALHGPRLRMLWEKIVDTPVRGVVYEAAGPLPPAVYASGLQEMQRAQERNEVPWAPIEADPRDEDAWMVAARAAVAALLGPRRGAAPAA